MVEPTLRVIKTPCSRDALQELIKREPLAYKDSSDTASLLMEWSNYDAENSPDEIDRIQNKYLNRKRE